MDAHNNSNHSVNLDSFGWQEYLTAVFLVFLILETLIGNIFVVIAIFTYKPLRNVQNFFVISLAVADMAVALLVMPFHVTNLFLNRWIFGVILCDMWLTFDVLLCTSSILNLCVIALDRYFAIHNPLEYAQKRTMKRVLLMIFAAWLFSAVISVPPLFGWSDQIDGSLLDHETGQCHLTQEKSYVIYSACGSFYIPLVIMSGVYAKIFIATRRRLRERAKASGANKLQHLRGLNNVSSEPPSGTSTETHSAREILNNGGTPIIPSTPVRTAVTQTNSSYLSANNSASGDHKISTFFQQRQRISLSKERKAARTLGFIMGAFVLCWLPFFLYYVIIPFCSTCHPNASVELFVVILGYVNSGLNPMIYTLFNNDFRKAFQSIFKKHCKCKESKSIRTVIKLNGQTML